MSKGTVLLVSKGWCQRGRFFLTTNKMSRVSMRTVPIDMNHLRKLPDLNAALGIDVVEDLLLPCVGRMIQCHDLPPSLMGKI